MTLSRPPALLIGITPDVFKTSGKMPSLREELISSAIIGEIMSDICFYMKPGIESRLIFFYKKE